MCLLRVHMQTPGADNIMHRTLALTPYGGQAWPRPGSGVAMAMHEAIVSHFRIRVGCSIQCHAGAVLQRSADLLRKCQQLFTHSSHACERTRAWPTLVHSRKRSRATLQPTAEQLLASNGTASCTCGCGAVTQREWGKGLHPSALDADPAAAPVWGPAGPRAGGSSRYV
jgi:hypothetical protein